MRRGSAGTQMFCRLLAATAVGLHERRVCRGRQAATGRVSSCRVTVHMECREAVWRRDAVLYRRWIVFVNFRLAQCQQVQPELVDSVMNVASFVNSRTYVKRTELECRHRGLVTRSRIGFDAGAEK